MKNILYILGFAAVIGLMSVSCSREDNSVVTPNLYVPSTLTVPYTGGTFYVTCTISREVAGAEVIPSTEDDWISGIDVSVEDTASFVVALNPDKEPRYGDIRFHYMNGADTLSSRLLHITQEYNSLFIFEAQYASGRYYGVTESSSYDNAAQYSAYFSDTEISEYGEEIEGATYYFLDFWTNADLEGVNYVLLPEGEYEFGYAGDNWIVSADSQYFVVNYEEEYGNYSEQNYFEGGSLTVTRSGDDTIISGSLEDALGGVHEISYSGPLYFENEGLISTLDGDEAMGDISDIPCEARYYGDYYQNGTANWLLCIYPETGTGFVIDISADASYDLDAGLPVGTFTGSSTSGDLDTFLAGLIFNRYLSGTWLLTLDEDGSLVPPYAPIRTGTIEISESDGSYTVTIDVYDDRSYNVTGSWTGVPTVSDYRLTSTAAKSERFHCLFPLK